MIIFSLVAFQILIAKRNKRYHTLVLFSFVVILRICLNTNWLFQKQDCLNFTRIGSWVFAVVRRPKECLQLYLPAQSDETTAVMEA